MHKNVQEKSVAKNHNNNAMPKKLLRLSCCVVPSINPSEDPKQMPNVLPTYAIWLINMIHNERISILTTYVAKGRGSWEAWM